MDFQQAGGVVGGAGEILYINPAYILDNYELQADN
jgi:hypothetical protein